MNQKTKLFSEIQIRELQFKNRIFVSPMCQFSAAEDGLAQAWHLVHLGTRATGGAALVMAEATAVSPEGRISARDLGLWNEAQVQALKPVTDYIHSQNSVSAIQLAHAGRKAGVPGVIYAPSAIAYSDQDRIPQEMTEVDFQKVIHDFEGATRLALTAGFQVVEVHMAHGYLLHEFLSPLSNQRKDQFGGSLENRMRFPLLIAERVRSLWPAKWPVFVRISASDWAEGGWDLDQSIAFSAELKKVGIDLIDCSSGGLVPYQKIPVAPNYQVPFAQQVKQKVSILTGAVGLITEAEQAEKILQQNEADVVFLAREILRNPYWPLQAAHQLGVEIPWPTQYERAKWA